MHATTSQKQHQKNAPRLTAAEEARTLVYSNPGFGVLGALGLSLLPVRTPLPCVHTYVRTRNEATTRTPHTTHPPSPRPTPRTAYASTQLMHACTRVWTGTNSQAGGPLEGFPASAMVAFAVDAEGRPLFSFSSISTHKQVRGGGRIGSGRVGSGGEQESPATTTDRPSVTMWC